MIVVDNNEQLPLRPFVWATVAGVAERRYLATRIASLDTGDYSIAGLENVVTVERKSLPDLWGTLYGEAENDALGAKVTSLDVFRREVQRMEAFKRAWILIEGVEGTFTEPEPTDHDYYMWRHRQWVPRSLVAYARLRYRYARGRGRPPERNVMGVLALLGSFNVDHGAHIAWKGNRDGAALWLGQTLSRIDEQASGGKAARKAVARGDAIPWLGALAAVRRCAHATTDAPKEP